jgi:hypothetical protein
VFSTKNAVTAASPMMKEEKSKSLVGEKVKEDAPEASKQDNEEKPEKKVEKAKA